MFLRILKILPEQREEVSKSPLSGVEPLRSTIDCQF